MKNKDKIEKIKANSAQNSQWFAVRCVHLNLDLMVYNSGRHLRAIGNGQIDFWPRTGRWWPHKGKAQKGLDRLADALEKIALIPDESENLAHMREIINSQSL